MDTLKYIGMVLQKDTKVGLTYGQVIATIAVLISLFGITIQSNIRMSQIEISQQTSIIRIEKLEEGRLTNAASILRLEERNIADHDKINEKLDRVLLELSRRR